MIEIRSKLPAAQAAGRTPDGQLQLGFDLRRSGRLRTRLTSGEEVSVVLPRGEMLRGGDLLAAADGRVIRVLAEPESLLHVECESCAALARIAYRLGNRHVPIEVGERSLRMAADHDLAALLEALGARVARIEAPFDPDVDAADEGHTHHHHGDAGHGHDHPHRHGHGHG